MKDFVFSFIIPVEIWIILGSGLLSSLWACLAYAGMARRVRRAVRRDTVAASEFEERAQSGDDAGDSVSGCTCGLPVSVVVRSAGDAGRLGRLLEALFSQEYAPGFEVIVVNEGACEDTSAVVDAMRLAHDNLYVTFTPDDGLNVSSKKLAVTLGVKAARYPVIVLTSADSVIQSRHWLALMTMPFADGGTEVVLGYSTPDVHADRGSGRRTRAFNHAEMSVAWISEALAGRPYRGSEANLAFTTRAFFRNKGFSRSLNLREGVDDIFVNEITGRHNTALDLSEQSQVVTDCYDTRAQMRAYRKSHAFTSRFVPRRGAVMLNIGSLSVWVATGLFAWAAVTSWPNLTVAAGAAALEIAMLVVLTLSWRGAIIALGGRRMLFTLPWMMLTRPFRAMFFSLRARLSPARNYTYSR